MGSRGQDSQIGFVKASGEATGSGSLRPPSGSTLGPRFPPLRYWGPACAASRLLRVGGCPCAHAQATRVGGDEIDICRRECQHMGVPVARDRCLTEEVREGPGFPGCLLCSLPIAQRNTLSEEQRGRGEGRGGSAKEGGGAKCLFPQALDARDQAEELRITKGRSPSTHPCRPRELPTKGHLPPPLPLPLYNCRGVQSLALGHARDLGSRHLSQCLHQLAWGGWGAGMPMQPALRGPGSVLSISQGTSCLSLGCPCPQSPSGTWLLRCAARPQTANSGQWGRPQTGRSHSAHSLEDIQPWAHLVAQVMGMRWVA